MSSQPPPQKKMRNDNDNDKDVVDYQFLIGSHSCSDHAKFCLLVPAQGEQASAILQALQSAKNPVFTCWKLEEDYIISDIRNIPHSLALPIRTINVNDLPSDDDNNDDEMTESDLLDWLIHGPTYFATKYALLTIQHRDSYDRRHTPEIWHYKISNSQEMKFVQDEFQGICKRCQDVDFYSEELDYFDSVQILDRGQYTKRFGTTTATTSSIDEGDDDDRDDDPPPAEIRTITDELQNEFTRALKLKLDWYEEEQEDGTGTTKKYIVKLKQDDPDFDANFPYKDFASWVCYKVDCRMPLRLLKEYN